MRTRLLELKARSEVDLVVGKSLQMHLAHSRRDMKARKQLVPLRYAHQLPKRFAKGIPE